MLTHNIDNPLFVQTRHILCNSRYLGVTERPLKCQGLDFVQSSPSGGNMRLSRISSGMSKIARTFHVSSMKFDEVVWKHGHFNNVRKLQAHIFIKNNELFRSYLNGTSQTMPRKLCATNQRAPHAYSFAYL